MNALKAFLKLSEAPQKTEKKNLGHTNLTFSLPGETMKNSGSVGRNKNNIMDFVNKCRFLKVDL